MSDQGLGEASGDKSARPQPGTSGAANLLEEIRYRIWHNTGCSDDAAEGAAAAVYDLFLDQKAIAADLLEALVAAEYAMGNIVKPDSFAGQEDTVCWAESFFLPAARAAIAKATSPSASIGGE